MLIEIHMLKNFGPTNLNRDEAGTPKTCMFGGVERGRISSQCLKRSWRKSDVLQNEIGWKNLGVRTRKLPELVGRRLLEDGVDAALAEAAVKKISGFGNKDGKENAKGGSTAQIVFYSQEDIDAVRLIYHLVKERGMTLAGARQKLKDNKETTIRQEEIVNRLKQIKEELLAMKDAFDAFAPKV
mgnify:CR=1 FL=1